LNGAGTPYSNLKKGEPAMKTFIANGIVEIDETLAH
jgi:hypothetical protein